MLAGVAFCRTHKFPEEALEYCLLQRALLCSSEADGHTQDSDHMASFLVLSSPLAPHVKATDSFMPRRKASLS